MKQKNKLFLVPILILFLCGCQNSTKELYNIADYNSSNFDNNYYTNWNNVDKIESSDVTQYYVNPSVDDPNYGNPIEGLRDKDQYLDDKFLEWKSDTPVDDYGIGYGPTKNLTSIDNSFAYGYLSKLYDGRVRCDGYYTKSRVQLNKTGYATFFPKALLTYKYFAFAVRGGTSSKYENAHNLNCVVNFDVTFYVRNFELGTYASHIFHINNISVPTNNYGATSLINFYFDDYLGDSWNTLLTNATAMSFTYNLVSSPFEDLSDDMNSDECHFAIMLYEIMLPDSTWN